MKQKRDPVIIIHHWGKTYRGKRPKLPSNHARFIASHAYAMGISVEEYNRRFCEVKNG